MEQLLNYDYIKSGATDIAICNFPIKDNSLQMIPYQEIQDTFVCGEKYKKLTEKAISIEQLLELPLLLLEKQTISQCL